MSRMLGDYLLGDVVEEDTHTITYRGERRAGDGRALLIKALKPGLRPSRRLRQSLQQEWDLLVRLAHPHLPTALGRYRSKTTMALVFVDHGGYRLHHILRQAVVLDAGPAVAIALAVAEALAAIHRSGGVHGQLSLSNVEVTASGQVFLHGLGAITHHDESLASPDGLAPEQLVGQPPDPRTDVFMLGALLYRMLAGRGPFDAAASGVGQRVRRDAPAPLPDKTPPLAPSLRTIVSRCLTKRPSERFHDMNSLVGALDHDLRSWSSLPRDVLASRAPAKAGLSEALAAPLEVVTTKPTGGVLPRLQKPLLLGVGAAVVVVAGWSLWRLSQHDRAAAPFAARGIVDRPAHVRVLAEPWAEVFLDGQSIDVTPIGQPIAVPPGKHTFVFKHPNASDEQRSIEVVAGQTILLDIKMQVVRPVVSAPPPPDSEDATP